MGAVFGGGRGGELRRRTTQEGPGDLAEDEYLAHIAAGVATAILVKRERGNCRVEKKSVYGAAIAMPQIARTARWSKSFLNACLRSYLFLIVNLICQWWILYLISKEQAVMDKFSGQMNLCDFAANLANCPGGDGCIGPGGTVYTAARLFNWDQWVFRLYIRDSFRSLFTDMQGEVNTAADPGEYGVESYSCRVLCCFLFMMAVMEDFYETLGVFTMLWQLPTRPDPWVIYEPPSWASMEHAKRIMEWTELDLVRFRVAGMPLIWKIINALLVGFPKLLLWKTTAQAGTNFLAETMTIENTIVNSIALTFVLNIDEMICESFTADTTRYILERMEDYPLYDLTEEEDLTEAEMLERHEEERLWSKADWTDIHLFFPAKLGMAFASTAFFLHLYYVNHCHQDADGTWISHDMYLPTSCAYSWMAFAFPSFFSLQHEPKPFWVMPGRHNVTR